jgi:hypothetical protein
MLPVYKIKAENLKGRDHVANLGVDGRVILSASYRNGVEGCGLTRLGVESSGELS